jgi:hypothetical protein
MLSCSLANDDSRRIAEKLFRCIYTNAFLTCVQILFFLTYIFSWLNRMKQHSKSTLSCLSLLDFPTLLHVYIFFCTLFPGKIECSQRLCKKKHTLLLPSYTSTCKSLHWIWQGVFFFKWDKLVKNKLMLQRFLQYNLQSVIWTYNNYHISRFSLPAQHSFISNAVWYVLYSSLGHLFCSSFDCGLLRLPAPAIRFTVKMRDEQSLLAHLSYRHLIRLLIYIKEQVPVFA